MNPQQQQPVMQPTNEFLMRMDAANAPVQEPEKKGPSKGLIIGIAIAVVAVIGIIVGVVMMNSGKTTTPTTTVTYTEPEPEIDEEMEARNALRKNDLVVLGEAVKRYQAEKDADGQLPGQENSSWNIMISQFVPGGVVKDSADGETYTMGKVCKFSEANCMDISSLSWEENKHQIYVMYNADCKGTTKDNVIVSSTRKRHAAIFAIIEGDQFICATND